MWPASPCWTPWERDERVTVMTAAMCQGNKLDKVRDTIPERFFDVGICESHAVAFAAGQAKSGLRPIVSIYSTFLQRSYDQIFQEVALQNLPVTFMLDRAGLTGPDGPTHHGMFDLGYLRVFPNMVVMAPGDEADMPGHVALGAGSRRAGVAALSQDRRPTRCAQRGTRGVGPRGGRPSRSRGRDSGRGNRGLRYAAGRVPGRGRCAARRRFRSRRRQCAVRQAIGHRHHRSLYRRLPVLSSPSKRPRWMGGFGSAVLEAAADAGLDTRNVRRLGIPDYFVEHGERSELLADLGLDAEGIAADVP